MRVVLTARTGTLAGQSFALEQGSLALGRDESCAVRFGTQDRQVSRRHAVVTIAADGARVTDHSSNGTLVNGQAVKEALLRDGDVLQLGGGGPSVQVTIEGGQAAVVAPPPPPYAAPAPPSFAPPAPPPAAPSRVGRIEASRYSEPTPEKSGRTGTLGILLVLGMVLAGSFLGLLTVLLTFFQLGVGAALAGTIVAFLPAPVYLAVWLWLDRYDPEPAWILGGAFLWGAGAATFVAGIINSLFQATMQAVTSDEALSEFLSASISAPFAEELFKGLAVLAIFLVLRREFDGVVDGIVYAGVVALGFATVENVLYYGRAMATKGPGMLVVVFVLRGVLGPFAHALFTSMTGIGCGIARQTHNTFLRLTMPVVGYLAAVTLHGMWNTLAGLTGSLGGYLIVYLLVWAPLFLVFFVSVIYLGHREAKLIARMLQLEVARGLLQPQHVQIAGSWFRRIGWLLSDFGRMGARRRFLHAMTRLALCYWHAGRAEAAGGFTVSAGQVPVFQREVRELLPRI
jgi:protease PrsW